MKNKFSIALSIALIMAMLVTSLALADSVVNNIDTTIDPALESRTITSGGSTMVGFYIAVTNGTPSGDPNGCNATGADPATVNLSVPAGVSASSYSLIFTGCGIVQNVTFSSSTVGSHTIDVASVTGGKDGSLWSTAPAAFTLTVSPPSDTTSPVITPTVTGTLGNNNWYVGDVSVSWTVTDSESTPIYSCPSITISSDTAGQTVTCTATSAGGTSSQSVTVKRDATAPTISGSVSPAPNGAGWNKTDVAVNFACDDNLSGVATCGPNQILVNEGANQSQSGTAVDNAGNSASFTLSGINIDKTVPTASASAAPAPNAKGWNNSDVTVSFSGSDSLSGIASCDSAVVLSTEGTGQSASGTCTDLAGNVSVPATVSGINIDKIAPTASATVSPSANLEGWNNTPVTVSFSGGDGAGSGIDYCDAAVVLSSEGTGQSASGTCTDNAGNVSVATTASGINIDMTPPSVAFLAGPADGAIYYFDFVPAPPTEQEIVVTDALSGPYMIEFTGYGLGVGIHTMTVKAYDKAGNMSTLARTYTVLAWTLNGFHKPVDMSGLIPVWNTVKGGSTVPLKFEVFAGATELTDIGYIQGFSATPVSCSFGLADAIEVTATGGTSLRYDPVAGQFIYNWQTPKSPGTCYKITMTTKDGSSLSALFKLK